MMPTGDETLPQAFAAAVGVLFIYMFGLADNDVVDARADAENAPDRPIPRGEISQPVALVAMFACLGAAFFLPNWILGLASPGTRMPVVWTALSWLQRAMRRNGDVDNGRPSLYTRNAA